MDTDSTSANTHSPSFNCYSNSRLGKIADRVVGELEYDVFYFESGMQVDSAASESEERGKAVVEEEEFEFGKVAVEVAGDSESIGRISGDEIFLDGERIGPVYPVFGRELLTQRIGFRGGNVEAKLNREKAAPIRLPLRKLFIDERETTMTSSCSSSEADDLDGVPADTYCVWRPKESAEARCKKSNSTGSHTKRWGIRVKELLRRSHSDVSKDGVVYFGVGGGGKK